MSSSTVVSKPRIVLCGSTSAYGTLLDVQQRLNEFAEVTIPPGAEKGSQGGRSTEESVKAKQDTDAFRCYFGAIRKSDAILVVNEKKHGIEGYVGPNTLIEMAFAHVLEKDIFLLNSLPTDSEKISWLPELRAIASSILTGADLAGKIRWLKEHLGNRQAQVPGLPYVWVRRLDAEADPRMRREGEKGRRVVALELMAGKSLPLKSCRWQPPLEGQPSWIVESGAKRFEVSTFNQLAKQDKHYHKEATEIYTVLEGQMTIWAADDVICLDQGDEIIVFPGTWHEVLGGDKFLARVHTINCHGDSDKYTT